MTTTLDRIDCYPLRLEAVLKERLWGGDTLARLVHKPVPPGKKIGESWEAWEGCRIANGRHAGQTLADLLAADPAPILGSGATAGAHFPLLFKYLDARDDLSVQVHPDDHAAWEIEQQPQGKTEAWYVLHAEPGATLLHGFNQEVDEQAIRAGLSQNTLADLLAAVPVQRGDVIFVPAGTVHAIGKGIVVAEIQQNSDTTYRLYDYDRRDDAGNPRELHVAKALRVTERSRLSEHQVPPLTMPREFGELHIHAACRYFALEQLTVSRPSQPLVLGGKFHVLACLSGEAQIAFGQSASANAIIHPGETYLLPACLGAYRLAPITSNCALLRMYVPSLRADIVEPLRQAGYSQERIARLGGPVAAHNDLLESG